MIAATLNPFEEVDIRLAPEFADHLAADIRVQDVLDCRSGGGRNAWLMASRGPRRLYALDARPLASYPWLRTYASLTVFELRKPDRPIA